MTPGDEDFSELHELINGAIDDSLSPPERDRLNQLLKGSEEALRYYMRIMQVSAALRSFAERSDAGASGIRGQSNIPPSVAAMPSSNLDRNWRWGPWIGGLTTLVLVVLLIAATIGILRWHGRSAPPNDAPSVPVAVLSQAFDVEWVNPAEAHAVGSSFLPGWVKIRSGFAQITFRDGATVIVEGPAELELMSAKAAFCTAGRLSAEVPPAAHGFQVTTPQLTITDLGTVFGVEVTAQGSAVAVFKGEVELSRPAGERQALHEGEGLMMDPEGKSRPILSENLKFTFASELQRRQAEHAGDVPPRPDSGKQGSGEKGDPPVPSIVFRGKARQTISGWGAGAGEDNGPGQNFGSLSEVRQAQLAKMIFTDTHIDTLRVWASLDSFSKKPGEVDISRFVRGYIESGFLKHARAAGVKRLLLAPSGLPQYMLAKDPSPAAAGQRPLSDDGVGQYAALVAEILNQLKRKHGIDFDMTGIANECVAITIPQWPRVVRELRKNLDSHGLRSVRITAVEWPNNDGWAFDRLRSIQKDDASWKSLDAISTHSYAMPATEDFYREFCLKPSKEFWITETECSGPKPVDCGKDLAGHLINDLNHGVTCWMYHEIALNCSPDNPATLVGYDFKAPDASWLLLLPKYHYYKQLSSALPVGTVLRQAWSNESKDMRYPGSPTKYTACGGKLANGSWAMAVVNLSPVNGGMPITLQLVVEELSTTERVAMKATRSGSGKNNQAAADVVFNKGVAQVTLEPGELLTLRQEAPPKP